MLFGACKKTGGLNMVEIENPIVPEVPVTPPPNPNTGTDVPADAIILDLGLGQGNLTIDGKTLKISDNTLIRVKGGDYKSITIKNILASSDKPVFIKNDGLVTISGSMQTDNISNVIISGDYKSDIKYGFSFSNISFRAIQMNGKMSGVTIKNMSFKDVRDYCISGEKTNGTSLPYDGTAASRIENFKILNCLFDHTGAISFGGNLYNGTEDSGLFKNVEIAYNMFQNSDPGTFCSFSNVQDYNIHHNVVNNVNLNNTNHNGVFFMQGNGSFHDNKLTNYQGNAIRMWLYSRGTMPVTVEIYNNICYNTKKYGGFELQAFERNMSPGKTTYANAKVYNNTVGKMNTSRDWEGQVLDLYNTGGTLEYYNNLGFDLYGNRAIGNMINNMSDVKIIKESNNKYLTSQSAAVNNLTTFVSLFAGIGASGI